MQNQRVVGKLLAVTMVILTVTGSIPLGPAIGTAAAGNATDGVQNPTGLPDDQIFEGTENGQIEVWDRALFTLRTNDTGADTQVPHPKLVQGQELGGGSFTTGDDGTNSASLVHDFGSERNPMGVHKAGDTIQISFDDDRASTGSVSGLDNQQRVEFVAAKLEGSGDGDVPSDWEEAIDLIGNEERANENASFRILSNSKAGSVQSLDANGNKQLSEDFSAGHWVIYAAVHESGSDGFETGATDSSLGIPDDNMTVDGDVAIVGVEQLTVHKSSATVTPPSTNYPGENLSFDVDTTGAFDQSTDGDVTHVLAVYNKTTFEDSRWDLVVDDSKLGPNFDVETDSELEHSIGDVVGVANVDDGIEVNGIDLSDGRVSKSVTVGSMLDFVAEEIDGDPTGTNAIDAGGADNSKTETLNASVTARSNQDRSATVNVDTFSNFTAGTYQYVLVSVDGDNSSATSTSTGTFTIEEPAAVASIDTTSLDYGSVSATPDGSTTSSKSVTITNTGNEPLKLSSFDLTGAQASQFNVTSGDATGTLDPGQSRTVNIAFEPTQQGSASATFSISTNDPAKPTIDVSLSGTGTRADLTVTNTEPVEFASDVGSTDSATVTVRNDGNSALSISSASITNDASSSFSVASSSGISSIAAGQTGTVTVDFNPSSAGNVSANLELQSNDAFESTREVRLSGLGRQAESTFAPGDGATLDYGTVNVDDTSYATVIVTNTGSSDLTVNSPSVSGNSAFSIASGSATTLGPGNSTTINVSVDPAAGDAGSTITGSLSVSTGDGSASYSLSADAKATEYDGPSSASFSDTPTGSATTTDVTISNTGSLPLAVDSLSVSGTNQSAFSVVGTTSDLVISPGKSRTVTVAFAPSTTGAKSASLDVATNDTGGADGTDESSASVSLSGTATQAALSVQGSSAVSFGRVGETGTSTKSITLDNVGGSDLSSLSASITGVNASRFSSSGLSSTVDAGDTTTLSVSYVPVGSGDHRATLTVSGTDTGGNSASTTVVLSGTGVPPDVALNTSSQNFGVVSASGASTRAIQVSNEETLDTTLSVNSVSISGTDQSAFTVTSQPTSDISSGESDLITVEFDPSSAGRKTATLTVATDDPDEPTKTVALSGTGSAPQSAVAPQKLGFGNVPFRSNATQNLTVTNTGGLPLAVQSVSITGTDTDQISIESNPASTTLVPGESATVTVRVRPNQTSALHTDGDGTESVSITTNATDKTVDVQVTPTVPNVSPSTADGGTLSLGSVSTGSANLKTLTVTNDGNAPLAVGAPSISGSNAGLFTVTNSPGKQVIGAGESLDYVVSYAPDATGSSSATLTLSDISDPDTDSLSYTLSGSGVAADGQMSDASVSFGQVKVDQTSSKTITLQNTGGSQLDVADVSIEGTDPGAFSFSGIDSSTSVSSGGSHSFTVSTTPATRGSSSALLNVTTESGDTVTSTLGVTGVEPDIEVADTTVSFNDTKLGDSSTETVTVTNNGNVPLNVTGLSVSGTDSGQFQVASETPVIVNPKASQTISVEFVPGTTTSDVDKAHQRTARSATLTIQSNDTDSAEQSVDASLTGTGVTPAVTTSSKALKYGTVSVGSTTTRTVTVSNKLKGTAGVEITSVSIDGPHSDAYSASMPSTTELAPGESTTVDVDLNPQKPGRKFATLTVNTNDTRQGSKKVFLTNRKTVVTVTFGSVTLSYSDPVKGAQPTMNVSRNLGQPAELSEFGINTTQSGSFDVKMETSESAFTNAESSSGFDSIRYVEVTDTNLDSSKFNEANFRFKVSKVAAKSFDVPKRGITLYHYNSSTSSYESLDTELVTETPKYYVYEASTTSFSEFSIGASKPSFSLSNLGLSKTKVKKGKSVDVTTDLQNTGLAKGTKSVGLEINGSTVDTKSVSVAAESTKTVTFTYTFNSKGTKTVTINGTSVGTVSVSGGGGGGGGDDDDDDPVISPPPGDGGDDGPTQKDGVLVVTPTKKTVGATEVATAKVSQVNASSVLSITTNTNVTKGDRAVAGLSSLNISVRDQANDVNVTSRSSADVPAGTPALDRGAPIGYLDIRTTNLTDDNIDDVTFTFTVSEDRRKALNVSKDDVVLYRYHDGKWRSLETSHVSGTTYEATSPGFSVFAIGTRGADVSVDSVSLASDTVTAGDAFTVTATLSNTGTNSTDVNVNLTADGSEVTTTQITLDRNETQTLDLSGTLSSPGTYTIGVYGTEVGTLDVTAEETTTEPPETTTEPPETTTEPPETTTEPPETTTEPPETTSTGIFGPGFGVPVALAALLLVAFLLRRRRD